MSRFPEYRPRRLRRTAALRNLVRETSLSPSQLVLPVFVRDGRKVRRPVDAMPGVAQTSVDEMLKDAEAAAKAGVGGIILFGIPETKNAEGSEAWNDSGAVQQAVRALKKELPDLVVMMIKPPLLLPFSAVNPFEMTCTSPMASIFGFTIRPVSWHIMRSSKRAIPMP